MDGFFSRMRGMFSGEIDHANVRDFTRPDFEVVIIDENDPGNELSDISRDLDFSTRIFQSTESREGFAENPEKQIQLAQFLITKFNLKPRGPLLDVGFGSNLHIVKTFNEQGIPAYAIDAATVKDKDKEDHTHKHWSTREYCPMMGTVKYLTRSPFSSYDNRTIDPAARLSRKGL